MRCAHSCYGLARLDCVRSTNVGWRNRVLAMHVSTALALLAALLSAVAKSDPPKISNTVYLIRHGEKPADDGRGLTEQGQQRAQCLVNVFGRSSNFRIGNILAQTPKSNGDRTRPLMTVTPLAQSLGIPVDTSCDRDDQKCVSSQVAAFASKNSTHNILICWEHKALTDIADALGVKKAPDYPSKSFDIIWTLENQKIAEMSSEECPGLDD